MKIPKFVAQQIATIYLKSYIPGRKSHYYVHAIELRELSSHPSQRPHRHYFTTADLLCEQHTINKKPKSLGSCWLEHGL